MSDNADARERKRADLKSITAGSRGVNLTTLADFWTLANAIVGSGMAPTINPKTGEKMTAGQVMIAIQTGAEVGLAPMASLKNIAIIHNRPTLWGDAIMALIHRSGELEEYEEGVRGKGDDRVGFCRMKRRGIKQAVERTFSVADAKKAGLWDKFGPWRDYPERMLPLRARGFTARDLFADKIGGFLMAEEARDIPEPRETVTTGAVGLLNALTAGEPADDRSGDPATPEATSDDEASAVWAEVEAAVRERDASTGGLFGDEP